MIIVNKTVGSVRRT